MPFACTRRKREGKIVMREREEDRCRKDMGSEIEREIDRE